MAQYSEEQKNEAKKLYLKGWKVSEIESQLDINRRSVYNWIKEDMWGEMLCEQSTLYVAHKRLQLLIAYDMKTPQQLNEFNSLMNIIERLEAVEAKKKKAKRAEQSTQSQGELRGQEQGDGKKKTRGKGKKNDFSHLTDEEILSHFNDGLYEYQLELYDAIDERIRQILKSRQIGLTYYFAREAFANALLTGDNQVFLSASRAQSDLFREYIKQYADDWFGIELQGKDKVEIKTPHGTATLYFLSTNSTTSQGYHGHVYVDEYFWIPNFEKLNKLASAMAAHKKWRKTYFSTPSTKSHGAYGFWSGDKFNSRMKAQNKRIIPFPTDKVLHEGHKWEKGDKQYRRIITLDDAEAKGCNLFDREQLLLEYSPLEFKQLFMCQFIDDSASIFRFSELEPCIVDRTSWKDFKPDDERPYTGPVWLGYDPARKVDGACIVVVAPPNKIGGKFRVLERIMMKNERWQFQANTIKELTQKYDVQYIGIDKSGSGSGVFEMVEDFFPRVVGIEYGVESKTRLVLKAQAIIEDKRLQWDAEWSDIPAGFMSIKQKMTGNAGVTYYADRSESVGHADAAWAIMHALINEGLIAPEEGDRGVTVCFEEAA